MAARPLVVTVRIPFCPKRCSFCTADVHVPPTPAPTARRGPRGRVTPTRDERLGDLSLRDAYLDAVPRELASMAADLQGHELRAVRLTGGVPTLCGAETLARTVRALRAQLPCAAGLEVGVQTLPGTLGVDALATLRSAGCTRFELGAATFNLFSWATLGRPVALEATAVTADVLRCANVRGWGVRLFTGLPGQTERSVADDVAAALDLGASHVRLEPLPLGENTPFWRHFVQKAPELDLPRRDLELPGSEEAARLQAAGERALGERGLAAYAPGCFAAPGARLRFEEELLGGCDTVELGLGGTSVVEGLRTVNTADLERYVRHADDPSLVVQTVEDLTL
jgi:oxygen-independent coproporphyrinogen-3 oxidase